MSISKILNSLEKSWERDDVLLNIKDGLGTDEIVNEFLLKNERQIKELNFLLRPKDIDLLNQIEKLSTCESKLINKIKNLNYLENNEKTEKKKNDELIELEKKIYGPIIIQSKSSKDNNDRKILNVLNQENKKLILSINCDKKELDVRIPGRKWMGSKPAKEEFENNLINDFC